MLPPLISQPDLRLGGRLRDAGQRPPRVDLGEIAEQEDVGQGEPAAPRLHHVRLDADDARHRPSSVEVASARAGGLPRFHVEHYSARWGRND